MLPIWFPSSNSSWWRHEHFSYYWTFVRGIHRPRVKSPREGSAMQSFDCAFVSVSARVSLWTNSRVAGESRRLKFKTHVATLWCFRVVVCYQNQHSLRRLQHYLFIPQIVMIALSAMITWTLVLLACTSQENMCLEISHLMCTSPTTGGFPPQRASNVEHWWLLCC